MIRPLDPRKRRWIENATVIRENVPTIQPLLSKKSKHEAHSSSTNERPWLAQDFGLHQPHVWPIPEKIRSKNDSSSQNPQKRPDEKSTSATWMPKLSCLSPSLPLSPPPTPSPTMFSSVDKARKTLAPSPSNKMPTSTPSSEIFKTSVIPPYTPPSVSSTMPTITPSSDIFLPNIIPVSPQMDRQAPKPSEYQPPPARSIFGGPILPEFEDFGHKLPYIIKKMHESPKKSLDKSLVDISDGEDENRKTAQGCLDDARNNYLSQDRAGNGIETLETPEVDMDFVKKILCQVYSRQGKAREAKEKAAGTSKRILESSSVTSEGSKTSSTSSKTPEVEKFVATPWGKFQIHALPDPKLFKFEKSSGYYYDATTKFYFDPKSTYFYCCKQKSWLFYSYTHSAYIPCDGEDKEGRKKLQLSEKDQKEDWMKMFYESV